MTAEMEKLVGVSLAGAREVQVTHTPSIND